MLAEAPNELLAVAAKGRLLEEARYELVVFDVEDVLLAERAASRKLLRLRRCAAAALAATVVVGRRRITCWCLASATHGRFCCCCPLTLSGTNRYKRTIDSRYFWSRVAIYQATKSKLNEENIKLVIASSKQKRRIYSIYN